MVARGAGGWWRTSAAGVVAASIHLAAVPVGLWVISRPLDAPLGRFLIWGPHGSYFFPQDYVVLAALVTMVQFLVGLLQLGLALRIRRGPWPETSAMVAAFLGGGSMFFSVMGVGGVFALFAGTLGLIGGFGAWIRFQGLDHRAVLQKVSSLGPTFVFVAYMWVLGLSR